MNYIGYFRDVNNNLYNAKIITNDKLTTFTTVVLGESPFTTESNADDIDTVLNLTDGTLKIVSATPLFDIYNSEA
jgi:hypothetical protein